MKLDALKAEAETPSRVWFWGHEYQVTPTLVREGLGDGLGLVAIEPMQSRPNWYMVRVDSSWVSENDATGILDHLEEIYLLIEDEFGFYREDDEEAGDDEQDSGWPWRPDLGYGCGYSVARVTPDDEWGRVPERFR